MALRLPMRYNAAGIEHIRIELNHAIRLCDAAKAGDLTRAERCVVDASAAYYRVLKLIPRVQLGVHDTREIEDKSLLLESLLRVLRERIRFWREEPFVHKCDREGLFEPELSAVIPLV